MADKTPEEVVQQQVDAYNARDLDAFAACFHTMAMVARLTNGQAVATGQEEVRRIWGYYFADNPGLRCTILSRTALGPFVIDKEEVSGLTNGRTLQAVAIYEVQEGLITRLWLLSDPGAVT